MKAGESLDSIDGDEFANTDEFGAHFIVPIVEWANSVAVLPTTSNQFVAASAHRNGTSQTGVNPHNSTVQLNLNSVVSTGGAGGNEGGGFDTSTGSFLVPVGGTGLYNITANVRFLTTNVVNDRYILLISRGSSFAGATTIRAIANVTPAEDAQLQLGGSTQLRLSAGDRIWLGLFGKGDNDTGGLTLTLEGQVNVTGWEITRLTDENGAPIPGIPFASEGVGGILSATAQTISGAKTFPDGISLGNENLSSYDETGLVTTFSDNGTSPGTSSSVTLAFARIGDWVHVFVPAFSLTVGSGSPTTLTSTSTVPVDFRPTLAQVIAAGQPRDNGGTTAVVGAWNVNTNGTIAYRKTPSGSWTASTSCGLANPTTFVYYVGTGS
jgi:hypothetical protein